ncbi:MAG: D-alanine aminotransferase [bacterium ADurb.BinA186]|nr:MAG: D-alanine aminotransferase [bacterium ADurb.BinA186]
MTENPIAYWNERAVPLNDLKIPVLDRAFFFGDAVYEVISIYGKKPFLFNEHLDRLDRSLAHVGITCDQDIRSQILKNIDENSIDHGMVYIQVSRGNGPRAHNFHNLALSPNVLIYSRSAQGLATEEDFQKGIDAITHEDLRWGRCDIKSTNLLANCLAQSVAYQRGAKEALLIRKDLGLTEGTSSNVFVVHNKEIATPPLSNFILPGTVRNHLIHLLKKQGTKVTERPIQKSELFSAQEVFITSTTREALGVISIDQEKIGTGTIGTLTKYARELIRASIGQM